MDASERKYLSSSISKIFADVNSFWNELSGEKINSDVGERQWARRLAIDDRDAASEASALIKARSRSMSADLMAAIAG